MAEPFEEIIALFPVLNKQTTQWQTDFIILSIFANTQGGGEEKGMLLILESAPDGFIWVFWLIIITRKKIMGAGFDEPF